MNVGIDGHTFDEKDRYGVSTYAFEVTKELVNQNQSDHFIIYSKENLKEKALLKENVSTRIIKGKFGWTQWRLSLEFLLNKQKPNVMVFFAHSLSRYLPIKSVVAVHDLAFKYYPQYFLKKDLNRLNFITDDAIKRSTKIIVPSESTKKDILKFYKNIRSEKISVIPMGYEKEIFRPQSKAQIKEISKKYDLGERYILYAGSFQPRKDLATLIKAFERIPAEVELVLAGGGGWLKEKTLEAIAHSKKKSKIKSLGYIPRKDLPSLYSGASCFVLPSLYEGFGMPLLEAMACGCPIIYSDNSSLTEIGQGIGLDFETKNVDQLADKLKKILSDERLNQSMSKRGIIKAKDYSWNVTARETMNVIKNL